ncbi:MAG: hypothetical protein JWN07_1642 [Hyphomicrobiales bacterium]|nr:hypothetical protein [Hyphomicrobiales bacterium]
MSDRTRARAEVSTFLRFCVVGGLGFLVDAGVLAGLSHATQMGPVVARCISAPVAIVATFILNRMWAFGAARETPLVEAFLAYCAIQGIGFFINFILYTGFVSLPLGVVSQPVVALALASCIALAFNFLGLRFFAFKPRKG